MTTECRRWVIEGRVQGVFFRASTREQAAALSLSGFARNRADGSVEVVACGGGSDLEALDRWLRRGPPSASVERVDVESTPVRPFDGFDVR